MKKAPWLHFAVALLLSVTTYTVKAQSKSDYIITLKGDTIKCKVKSIFLGSGIRFKSDKMEDYKEVDATMIKQYYRSKNAYPYRAIIPFYRKKPEFMTVIEEGKINLYQHIVQSYANGHSMINIYWYVQKGTDTVRQIKSSTIFNVKNRKERKDEFLELISDNKEVLEQYINAKSFSFDQIRASIHYYNTGEAPAPEPVETEEAY